MASNACFSIFAATEEVPIIHYYGMEVLTMAKKIMISALLLKVNKVDVEEFLKETFKSKKQIVLAPYYGGKSYTLDDIPFEALEELCVVKPSSEPCPIVSDHNEDEYNIRRMAYLHANPDEKPSELENIRTFVQTAVLENLSASVHKEFVSYFHPVQKQQLLLLGNRKIYSTNKQKILKFEQSQKKDEATKKKSEATAALSASSQNSKKPASVAAVNQDHVELKPSSKKRSTRKDINYKEPSGESTSSVEYPVEGKHTDDESEDKASESGIKTPIFPLQNQVQMFEAPNSSTQATGGPSAFYTRIPKNKKKISKHSRSSRSPSLDDLDTKPSSNKEKRRLERKKSSKHHKKSSKKAAKKARKYSSSSSVQSSSSDTDSSPSDQAKTMKFEHMRVA